MIALIRSGQAGELVSMGIPVEVAAIYYTTAYLSGVTVHILGGTVGNNVATPLKGTAVDRCSKGIVHNQGHTVLVSHLGKALYIEYVTARVADGLAEEALGIGTELLLDALIVPIGIDEGALYAQLLHRYAKEVVRTAIDAIAGDKVIASLADIEDSIEVGSLTAGGQHSAHTTFQCCNLLGYSIVGGIGQTGIEVTAVLQVEQTGHLLAGIVFECCTLIDGQLLRFALCRLPSAVDANCL